MTVAQRLLTAEEYFSLPEPPEGGKMELVRGELVTVAPVGGEHGRLARRLVLVLAPFVESHALGEVLVETGYRLARNPDIVRAPDISFLAADRMPGGRPPRSFVEGPPNLAVEITSPDDRDADIQDKVAEYLAAGCQRVWVVRPKLRSVTVHHPGGVSQSYGTDATLASEAAGFAVEGFGLTLEGLFN